MTLSVQWLVGLKAFCKAARVHLMHHVHALEFDLVYHQGTVHYHRHNMAAASYRYLESLGAGQIRLLDLKAGDEQDDIEIELQILDLSQTPQYEALSYEWGTTRKTQFVRILGSVINITHGLYLILKQIRDKSQSRRLWIDAISINQEDGLEKSLQITQMAIIFGRATRVLIWLGPQGNRPHDVFQMLSALARLWIERKLEMVQEGELRPLSWTTVGMLEMLFLQPWDKDLWLAIYELTNRPYFRRTWIVQEVAVAKDARVLCGPSEMSWTDFVFATSYLSRSLYHLHQNSSDAGLARISAITNMRSAYQSGATIELADVCIISQTLQATHGQDKVYGFLGLLRGKAQQTTVQKFLRVDYNIPAQVVYLRAAQYSILESQDLRICHCKAFLSEIPGAYSSWAPDWSMDLSLAQTIVLRPHNKIKGQIKGSISFDSDVMRLPGYHIDRISCVSDPLTSENPLPDIQRIMVFLSQGKAATYPPGNEILAVQDLEYTIDRLKQLTYLGQESLYEATWRTLISNTALFVTAHSTFRQHFDAIVDSLRLRARGVFWKCVRACDKLEMDDTSLSRLEQDPIAQQLWQCIQAQDAGPYYRELVNTIGRRIFFTTEKGYIGFGSPGGQVGDSIAILKGGWTPFMLRQQGNGFRMIGDTYVHGIRTTMLLSTSSDRVIPSASIQCFIDQLCLPCWSSTYLRSPLYSLLRRSIKMSYD